MLKNPIIINNNEMDIFFDEWTYTDGIHNLAKRYGGNDMDHTPFFACILYMDGCGLSQFFFHGYEWIWITHCLSMAISRGDRG